MRHLFFILTALLLTILPSCSNKVAYDEFVSLADANWDKDTLAVFAPTFKTPSASTTFSSKCVTTTITRSPISGSLSMSSLPTGAYAATLSSALANPDGSWLGEGGEPLHPQLPIYE